MFYGGSGTNRAYGIHLTDPDFTATVNNLIHGGSSGAGFSYGVFLENATNLTLLYNNTVLGGNVSGAGSYSMAVNDTTGTANFVNNILIGGLTPVPAESIAYLQGVGSVPSRFMNNLLLSRESAGTAYAVIALPINYLNTVGDIDLQLGGPLAGIYEGYMVSPGENPSSYFVNFSPDGGEAAFLNDNWRLSGGGSQPASGGGFDLSADTDFNFDWDYGWTARSVPWSIGAYE